MFLVYVIIQIFSHVHVTYTFYSCILLVFVASICCLYIYIYIYIYCAHACVYTHTHLKCVFTVHLFDIHPLIFILTPGQHVVPTIASGCKLKRVWISAILPIHIVRTRPPCMVDRSRTRRFGKLVRLVIWWPYSPRKTLGKPLENHRKMLVWCDENGIYPLVSSNMALENPRTEWCFFP